MKDTTTNADTNRSETMKELKKHIDEEVNVETLLFVVDDEYRVRVRDLDAGENVSLVSTTNKGLAEAKYAEAIAIA